MIKKTTIAILLSGILFGSDSTTASMTEVKEVLAILINKNAVLEQRVLELEHKNGTLEGSITALSVKKNHCSISEQDVDKLQSFLLKNK